METYGDLKRTINNVLAKKKAERVGKAAVGAVISAIPGLGAAKDVFDVGKALFNKPDGKKTNTWLDKLDVDDEASSIVDDTVEDTFIKDKLGQLTAEPDEKPLDPNFSMNKELIQFLKNKYKGRTLLGIKESKMKIAELKHMIKQEILAEQEKAAPGKLTGGTQELMKYLKRLDIQDFDQQKFNTTFQLVKQGKPLNVAANKILANTMIALIKNQDDSLLRTIFSKMRQVDEK